MSTKLRFCSFVLLIVSIFVSSVGGAILGGPLYALLLPLPLLVVVWVLRKMFLPRFSGQTRIRLGSITLIYGALALLFVPVNPLSVFLTQVLSDVALRLGVPPVEDPFRLNIVPFFVVCATVLVLNLIWHRKGVSEPGPGQLGELENLTRRDFERSLERYCTALCAELDRYDREVNWSDRELAPLEAEVESERSGRLRSRIVPDLVAAIRRDRKSSVFVVLGDPGSGKSVSLRRLVRVLCRQAKATGVVPVYVNLREYPETQKPTTGSIVRFVREVAQVQTGRDGRAFLDTWYEPFRKNGRLFFVMDSFDELPAVMDCDDRSDSHKEISAALDRFFTQEVQSCRAVLASRIFRAPVGVKGTHLVIRPFRESQIRSAMRTWLLGKGIDANRYVRRLFRETPQLVPFLRNPFSAELIAEYARSTGGELPPNLFSVFDQYVSERLRADLPELDRLGISPEQVRQAAATVARRIYEAGDLGLEADVDQILAVLAQDNCDKERQLIEALSYTRVARVGGRDRRRFSFVHRRFAEFFVVSSVERMSDLRPLESIPTDSRWRDCLVMYCGIANAEDRTSIADNCWSVISSSAGHLASGDFREARDAVHCLRFLGDAFRGDSEALAAFSHRLGAIVVDLLKARDPLAAKIAAECIPLVDEKSQSRALEGAFMHQGDWVRDTALGSCRHMGSVERDGHQAIRKHIRLMPRGELLGRLCDLNFSFGLSEAFRRQKTALWADCAEMVLVVTGGASVMLFLGIVSPPLLLGVLVSWVLCSVVIGSGVLPQVPRILDVMRSRERDLSRSIRFVASGLRIGMRAYLWMFERVGVTARMPDYLADMMLRYMRFTLCIFVLFLLRLPTVAQSLRSTVPWSTGLLVRAVVFLILAGWEIWPRLVHACRRLDLERFKSAVISVCVMVAAAGAALVLMWVFSKAWLLLPTEFQEFLAGLGKLVVIGGLCVTLLVPCVMIAISSLRYGRDRVRLRRIGIPLTISCQAVYDACLSFDDAGVRRLLLQEIRRRRVPLVGEVVDPPKALLGHPAVAEELGRLREQWYGLAT